MIAFFVMIAGYIYSETTISHKCRMKDRSKGSIRCDSIDSSERGDASVARARTSKETIHQQLTYEAEGGNITLIP